MCSCRKRQAVGCLRVIARVNGQWNFRILRPRLWTMVMTKFRVLLKILRRYYFEEKKNSMALYIAYEIVMLNIIFYVFLENKIYL